MLLVSATWGKLGVLRVGMLSWQNIRISRGLALTSVMEWRIVVLGGLWQDASGRTHGGDSEKLHISAVINYFLKNTKFIWKLRISASWCFNYWHVMVTHGNSGLSVLLGLANKLLCHLLSALAWYLLVLFYYDLEVCKTVFVPRVELAVCSIRWLLYRGE